MGLRFDGAILVEELIQMVSLALSFPGPTHMVKHACERACTMRVRVQRNASCPRAGMFWGRWHDTQTPRNIYHLQKVYLTESKTVP
jgi:hypothetical protein